MKRHAENSGLRRHRPRKRFRFEYIKGKFSGMTAEGWFRRAFDEMEKEEDGHLIFVELFERYGKREGGAGPSEKFPR